MNRSLSAPSGTVKPPQAIILWGALLMSIGIYAGVATFIRQSGGAPEPPAPILLPVLAFVALGNSMFALVGVRRITAASGNYTTYAILRWALAESVAIFGLVLALVGFPLAAGYAFIGWAAFLMVLMFPSDADFRRFTGRDAGMPGVPSMPSGPGPIEPQ